MKQVPLKIENMKSAYEALNDALQSAMTIMTQKAATEASVGLTINIEIPGMFDGRLAPNIKYKTSIKVPMVINSIGLVGNLQDLYWDPENHGWMVSIEGEQMRLEEAQV